MTRPYRIMFYATLLLTIWANLNNYFQQKAINKLGQQVHTLERTSSANDAWHYNTEKDPH